MTTGVEWSISASDDEWDDYDPKSDIIDITNIPVRIALLFKDIHENKGLLSIKCNCPRVGVKDSTLSTPVLPPSSKSNSEVEQRDVNEPNNETEQKAADSSKIYEAFEFDDDNDAGPTAAIRKTPASGAKRVNKKEKASLTNVVNDIRRQKLLDDMEAAAGNKAEPADEGETKKT